MAINGALLRACRVLRTMFAARVITPGRNAWRWATRSASLCCITAPSAAASASPFAAFGGKNISA